MLLTIATVTRLVSLRRMHRIAKTHNSFDEAFDWQNSSDRHSEKQMTSRYAEAVPQTFGFLRIAVRFKIGRKLRIQEGRDAVEKMGRLKWPWPPGSDLLDF